MTRRCPSCGEVIPAVASHQPWTPLEDRFLRANWRELNDQQLAEELIIRTSDTVRSRRLKLGLRREDSRDRYVRKMS